MYRNRRRAGVGNGVDNIHWGGAGASGEDALNVGVVVERVVVG